MHQRKTSKTRLFHYLGTPNRDINFADKSGKFDKHAHKLANTARLVATAGTTRNKRTVEAIHAAAQQVRVRSQSDIIEVFTICEHTFTY